jgi:hypothetical protein
VKASRDDAALGPGGAADAGPEAADRKSETCSAARWSRTSLRSLTGVVIDPPRAGAEAQVPGWPPARCR